MAVKKRQSKRASGVNRSEAIRDFKAQNKAMKPKQISQALAEQGIIVTPQYVSMVLSLAKKNKGKRGRPAGGTSKKISKSLNASADVFSIEDLRQARNFAEKTGGVPRAQQVLAAYKHLVH